MAKRKRLTPAQPDYLSAAPAARPASPGCSARRRRTACRPPPRTPRMIIPPAMRTIILTAMTIVTITTMPRARSARPAAIATRRTRR